MTAIAPRDRLFCALDTTDLEQATSWAKTLNGLVGGIKIGKEFFTAHGPQGIGRPQYLGCREI
jgi:orotidine-5'-phosphate decarboxylase